MNRIFRFCCTGKSSAVASEDGEGEEKEPGRTGRHGHRKTSVSVVPSSLVAAGEHSMRKRGGDRQGEQPPGAVSHKTVVPHEAAVSYTTAITYTETAGLTVAPSAQWPTERSAGGGPKQCPQPALRKTGLQVASALALSDISGVSNIGQALIPPELPQSLSEKGYRLTSVDLLDRGAIQRLYPLTRKMADGSEESNLVIKFPCEKGRDEALRGLAIQEKLAGLKDGDQYFVPVVEKAMESGRLICHVEPEGIPVLQYRKNKGLELTQKLSIFSRILKAIKIMHDQGIVHLDIKPDNLVMKNPAIDMTIRFCDFDSAVNLDPAEMKTPSLARKTGTPEYMCNDVLRRKPCFQIMVDLWSFTLTAWTLMASASSDSPVLHWLSGMMNARERRYTVSHELAGIFSMYGQVKIIGEESLTGDKIQRFIRNTISCFSKQIRGKVRQQLQLLFWKSLKFPADIDDLQLSAAEKYILKEMLSIMFSSLEYRVAFENMTNLMTAASRCAEMLETHFEYGETEILSTIRSAGYLSCNYVESLPRAIQPYPSSHSSGRSGEKVEVSTVSARPDDKQDQKINHFMVRKQQLLDQFIEQQQVATQQEVKDILTDYCARGESLDVLKKKNDSELLLWLETEWQKRHDPQENPPQLKQAC